MPKKVLVTGAYGYIGSHTVKALAEHGYAVHALDKSVSPNDIGKYAERVIISDILNPLTRYEKYYDVVVHLAG